MKARLLGRTGAAKGLTREFEGGLVRLGTDGSNEVVVAAPGLARVHATVTFANGSFWLEDLDTQAGTFLNGRRAKRERLSHLDVVTLGESLDLVFVLVRENAAPAPAHAGDAQAAGSSGPSEDAKPWRERYEEAIPDSTTMLKIPRPPKP